nr:aldo/keto reductase [Prochlorococcus sp. MIT 1300]
MMRRSFGAGSQVSLFTLGTMRALESSEQMFNVLKAAYFSGINHIETAPSYGQAEAFVGLALKEMKLLELNPPGGWVITSKIIPGLSFEEGKNQLKKSILRLGISKVNNLAIHGLNLPEHLHWAINGDGKKLLNWAKREGLIDQIGFSSHGSKVLIKKALTSKVFQFCSLHLHLLDPGRLPLAKKALEEGIGVMAISPADKGGRLQAPSKILTEDCNPIPPLELAYRFLIANGISTLTLGASKPEDFSIAQKLAHKDGPLTKQEEACLLHLQFAGKKRLGITQCGQCQKCLPCPEAVPIPEILRLRNLAIGHDLIGFAKERYNLIGKAGHWWESVNGDACENCQECLPRCPYQLPIPELLSNTHQLLKDSPRRRLWE